MPSVVLDTNAPVFTIAFVNKAYAKLAGSMPEELMGKGLMDTLPQRFNHTGSVYSQKIKISLTECIQTQERTTLTGQPDDEHFPEANEPETRNWQATNIPVLNKKGEVDYILHQVMDVTAAYELARKERIAQEVAKARQLELEHLFRQAPAGVVIFGGPNFVFDLVNPTYQSFFPGRELTGKPLLQALPELAGHPLIDGFRHTYETGEPFYGKETYTRLMRVPNDPLDDSYWNFIAQARYDDQQQINGILMFGFEVTEQVKARQRLEVILNERIELAKTLRASEQRLQGLLDTMAEGVGITDTSGRIVYANLMAEKILGLKESEITSRNFGDANWQNLRLDGSPLPAEDHPMALTMRTGVPVYDQEIAVQPPGRERYYISINAAPILDEHGVLIGGIGTFMDVTNRRKLMMQKDDFISVASHELKTPVTSLKASLQFLARQKENISTELLNRMLTQANKSLDKLSSLIGDLLNSNRINEGQLQIRKTTFDLAGMLNDCCNHIKTAGEQEIVLKGDIDVQVLGDEHQLNQVLVNFLNNAVKYAPKSKEITIEITNLGSRIKVGVTDYGPGIPPEKIQHLFDRYYRADYSGIQFSGLGLGLYISAEIIRKHGGEIGVESELGEGSTFWFTLPVSE